MKALIPGVVVLVLCAGVATWADGTDEDLATVRRAVTAGHTQAAHEESRVRPRHKPKKPRLLKIRVEEHGQEQLAITVPLALAKSLGDQSIEIPGCDEGAEGRHLRLGEVLEALEAGQEIVRIDSKEGSVRVWVE